MSDELKPVRCGCGGEAVLEIDHDTIQPGAPIDWKRVRCNNCNIRTTWRKSEAEAIEAWNTAMGTNTRKLLEVLVHDATDTNVGSKERTAKVKRWDGYSEKGWYKCDCGKGIHEGQNYCSGCGVKLDWSDDE